MKGGKENLLCHCHLVQAEGWPSRADLWEAKTKHTPFNCSVCKHVKTCHKWVPSSVYISCIGGFCSGDSPRKWKGVHPLQSSSRGLLARGCWLALVHWSVGTPECALSRCLFGMINQSHPNPHVRSEMHRWGIPILDREIEHEEKWVSPRLPEIYEKLCKWDRGKSSTPFLPARYVGSILITPSVMRR